MTEKEIQEYLDRIYELVKENNKMLKAEKRARFFGGIMKIIWWAIIIGLPILLYYKFIAPVLGNMQDAIAQLEGLSRVNPQIGKQIEPIIQTLETLSSILKVK